MRNLLYTLLCLSAFTFCSDPDHDVHTPVVESALFRGIVAPDNPNNPYDIAGQLHADILESYIPIETEFASPSSTIAVIDSIATADSRFSALAFTAYTIPTATQVMAIISDTDAVYSALASYMSPTAISTLKSFCQEVVLMYANDVDFTDAYNSITAYEATIVAGTFSYKEKEVMLTNSSIARYSLWLSATRKKRKPRDRDWDTLFTALTASIEGAETSTANAIMLSVATAAVGNQ